MFTAILKITSLASLCLLGAGCYSPVVSTWRQPISSRKAGDFEFVKLEHPGKAELESRLGKPDAYFPDLRVSVYPVDTVIRRRLTLFLFVLPVGASLDYNSHEVAYIEFDEHDNAQRCDVILKESYGLNNATLYREAESWLADPSRSDIRQ